MIKLDSVLGVVESVKPCWGMDCGHENERPGCRTSLCFHTVACKTTSLRSCSAPDQRRRTFRCGFHPPHHVAVSLLSLLCLPFRGTSSLDRDPRFRAECGRNHVPHDDCSCVHHNDDTQIHAEGTGFGKVCTVALEDV